MPRQTEATARRRPGRPSVNFPRRQDEIIRVATRLFAERGYHGTSIADICAAANIGRGVLYHYVPSKEHILVAIHERFIEPLLSRAREIAAANDPPDVTLSGLGRELVGTIAEYLDEVTVFLHEWKALAENEESWIPVRAKRREFECIIQDTIERGQRVGMFKRIDPRMTALAFLSMHAYTYQWYRTQGRLTAEQIAEIFADICLNGVMLPRPVK
jgi:AcrR family transcriptional regulator